jgi:hypothetical protein
MSLVRKDVRGDGSCFLRAVYRAALESDPWRRHVGDGDTLLLRLKQALPVGESGSCGSSKRRSWVVGTADDEDAFVRCARKSLCAFLKQTKKFRLMYKNLIAVEPETRVFLLEMQPVWLAEIWSELLGEAVGGGGGGGAASSANHQNALKFERRCLAKIRTSTMWFGETEVREFAHFLGKSDFDIRIENEMYDGSSSTALRAKVNAEALSKSKRRAPGDNAVPLFLVNVNESHYNYFGPDSYIVADTVNGYFA